MSTDIGRCGVEETPILSIEQFRKILFHPDRFDPSAFTDLKCGGSFSTLGKIPKDIEKFINLRTIYIAYNHLDELPEELGNLSKLENLNASVNQLTSLPESMKKLTNLQELDLQHNRLGNVEVPPVLFELPALTYLNLASNGIKEFSVGSKGEEPIPLKALNLSMNEIHTFSGDLKRLSNLVSLNLSRNSLKELPENMGDLKGISFLNLSHNDIRLLPYSISEMEPTLVTIDLRNNLNMEDRGDKKTTLGKKDLLDIFKSGVVKLPPENPETEFLRTFEEAFQVFE